MRCYTLVCHVYTLIFLTPSDEMALKSTDEVSTDLDVQKQSPQKGGG